MISGSFSENSRNTANRFKKRNWPVIELTDERPAPLANFATRALVKLPTKKLPNPNGLPRRLALWLKQHLRRTPVAPAHLLIEGGDTAAAILQTFGWHDFHVLHQWEPGVVTLQPEDSAAPPITIKPGSYPWPREILTAR